MDWDPTKGLEKIGKYCAYQDRCHMEVKHKLKSLGCPYYEMNEILVKLIDQGFLDEERFARSYARGKFKMKSWGRIRIRRELKMRQINEMLIDYAIKEEISEEAYTETVEKIAFKKAYLLDYPIDRLKREKIIKYIQSRGFEWEYIEKVLPVVMAGE